MTGSADTAPAPGANQAVREACLGDGAILRAARFHGFNPLLLDILRSPPRHVLEHLYDPWRALARVRDLLAPGAQVAVSLPNVRNLSIHARLHNEGRWRYEPHGLLDITHIRFFALRDAIRMLEETGHACVDLKRNIDPAFASLLEAHAGKPTVSLSLGRLKLDNLTAAELQEYCTRQFILLATPACA